MFFKHQVTILYTIQIINPKTIRDDSQARTPRTPYLVPSSMKGSINTLYKNGHIPTKIKDAKMTLANIFLFIYIMIKMLSI